MKWYFTQWNGDFRLETVDGRLTLLVHKPTLGEAAVLAKFFKLALKKSWLPSDTKVDNTPVGDDARYTLDATMDEAGKALLKLLKPERETLTALKFEDGRIETAAGTKSKETALAPVEKAVAAVSVARPTLCCPNCIPGSIEPAREVLLEFLTPAQHDQWAAERAIEVIGQLSGHRYVLAHRHSKLAQRWGKVCRDVDAHLGFGATLHFHDWSVPPEEEILAAKLMLETREPWLRNECTMAGPPHYKNPFGDIRDGTLSAGLMGSFGMQIQALAGLKKV